eukprot:11710981-Alexandrium_andersonii.AAC.1
MSGKPPGSNACHQARNHLQQTNPPIIVKIRPFALLEQGDNLRFVHNLIPIAWFHIPQLFDHPHNPLPQRIPPLPKHRCCDPVWAGRALLHPPKIVPDLPVLRHLLQPPVHWHLRRSPRPALPIDLIPLPPDTREVIPWLPRRETYPVTHRSPVQTKIPQFPVQYLSVATSICRLQPRHHTLPLIMNRLPRETPVNPPGRAGLLQQLFAPVRVALRPRSVEQPLHLRSRRADGCLRVPRNGVRTCPRFPAKHCLRRPVHPDHDITPRLRLRHAFSDPSLISLPSGLILQH